MECIYPPEIIEVLENVQDKRSHIGITDRDGNLAAILLTVDEYRLIKYLSDLSCTPERYQEMLDDNALFQKGGRLDTGVTLDDVFADGEQYHIQAASCTD